MDIYHSTCFKISKIVTTTYSTSFSWGIKLFSAKYQDAIYGIYGFVRLADEIVDTFLNHDQKSLLENLRNETYQAIRNGISTNPILNSFQAVVNKYNIDSQYIDAFLNSMESDLKYSSYDRKNYDEYIFGSAEAVGLMCLKVFCHENKMLMQELIPPARSLGSAFQKVNFLRDVGNDLDNLGRIYFPNVHDRKGICNEDKIRLENEVREEFANALEGILLLPEGVRLGVYLAYRYYFSLFKKIQKLDIQNLVKKRVRVTNYHKFFIFLNSIVLIKLLSWKNIYVRKNKKVRMADIAVPTYTPTDDQI